MNSRLILTASAAAAVAVVLAMPMARAQGSPGAPRLEIAALSTDPALVTGGDVLLTVAAPASISAQLAVSVKANGRDITSAFRQGPRPNTWIGLVTGLPVGSSTIAADAGRAHATLAVTNYPITGPVLSGPWLQPFICQTAAFTLPDGSTLGPPLDSNCSARTSVQYIYKPVGAPNDPRQWLKALPSTSAVPPDVAKTTTVTGATVNFIVRVETGTMNRGIYQNAVLHDPTVDPAITPFTPPKGWNRRLVAMHGVGCPTGWYLQGAAQGVNILDADRLGAGDAIFINTLNHPANSCNALLAGETAMMGKEHFIETFGAPAYTISTGRSGGAYTSLQIADAFPGLFDGIDIGATFPDALSIALSGLDARLLAHYYTTLAPGALTEDQKVAITGYHGMKAFIDAANQSQRTDPVPNRNDIEGYQSARWNEAVPPELRYDPATNPHGARPTVFDVARNVYGVDPVTGAALRPFDNIGVQYGLAALNAGVISPAQFLDLNEKIGGYDQDANYVRSRTAGDAGAIKRAYQAGLTLGANGGLTAIPIFDNATSNETRTYHYGWFHFAVRERLRQATGGSSENMVMWRSVAGSAGQQLFDRWVAAYKSDASNDPQRTKVLRARPREAVDGCYDKAEPPAFIADDLPFSSKPVSRCSELYPVYSNPRKEAGGPLAANILKCQLKAVDAKDYRASFTPQELARLRAAFPAGVCDWSKAGVNQTPVVTWPSVGPSPRHLIFELNGPRSSSR
jgi:hypothetical protein